MTDRLLSLLPEVFQVAARTNGPLRALSAVADDLHAPAHRILEDLHTYVDPQRAPEPMLAFLARWVDLDWLTMRASGSVDSTGAAPTSDRLRDLLANATDLAARRGTAAGIRRFLHLATGVDGFTVDDVPGAFHVRVGVPAAAAGWLPLVARIVATTKPVHTTASIELLPDPRAADVPAPAGGDVAAGAAGQPAGSAPASDEEAS